MPQNAWSDKIENISINKIPELDANMLEKIRDQLLLQKMYEDDLKKFKKFKTTQNRKKKKGLNRKGTSTMKYHKGKAFIINDLEAASYYNKPRRSQYPSKKPKGFEDISQRRYEELLEEVEREKAVKERSKSKRKRPQTANYPIKKQYESKYKTVTKKKKMSKKKESEYMNIIKEYEDVLKDKVKAKKSKKRKAKKKEPFTLASKYHETSKSSTDPFEKYISFYPSRTSENDMFEKKYEKE